MRSLSEPKTKAALVRHLMSKVPKNSLNLPEGIYRTDLIPDVNDVNGSNEPPQVLSPREPDSADESPSPSEAEAISVFDGAFLPLAYVEGFPALPDGNPFWYRLDFEPLEAFQAFEAYLSQGDQGARQLFILGEDGLENGSGPQTTMLMEWFDLYYWEHRCKSFDLFRIAQARKMREQRALTVDDNHYMLATRLMDQLEAYMLPEDGDDNEFFDLLTPKVAIDLLKLLTQMQRVSSGLPASGPSGGASDGSHQPGASVEVIMRNIIQGNQGSMDGSGPIIDQSGREVSHLDALENALQDPDTAALAQELVIKLNSPST